MTPITRQLIISALAGTAIAAISGCGGVTAPPPSTACAATPPTERGSAPVVAVLAPTVMPTGTLAAQRAATFTTVVAGARSLGAQFMLNGIGAGIGAPNLLVNTTLVAQGSNDLMRQLDLSCKEKVIDERYRQLANDGTASNVDVISALSTLHDDLENVPHGVVQVVVLGSAAGRTMLSSRSALILADPRTLANPARAIDRLARAGLNFKCRGWRVTMVDGSSTPRGTSLSPTEDSGLRRFWALYFRHCGGALVSYSTQLVAFPVSGPAITGADYSTIPTSTIQVHVARRRHTIVATLTGNVLFTTNSAALRPGARAALAKLLTLIAAARGRITVVGYTDSRGGATINGPLSRARARSVARWIVMRAHVRPGRLTVHGLGARDPVATNATAVGRARNRRVVVTIHVG